MGQVLRADAPSLEEAHSDKERRVLRANGRGRKRKVPLAVTVSGRYPTMHGEPVHDGRPDALGVRGEAAGGSGAGQTFR